MSIKEFDRLFGLSASIQEEKIRFINRIEIVIFDSIIRSYELYEYSKLFETVCFHLGEDPQQIISEHSGIRRTIPNLKVLSNKDFMKTLRVVVALMQTISSDRTQYTQLSSLITGIINKSNLNLGIKWNEGVFYPTGEKILDEELIDVSLSLLAKFPNEKKDLQNALESHNAKSLYGVVENCYLTIEGLARQLLNNKKTLDNNKEDFLRMIQLSSHWNKILANYIQYANEYRRHASEDRHSLKDNEVEAYLYLTCLLVRACLKPST